MSDKPRLAPGDSAPEFTLPDADGAPVSLSTYRGRRVIVYFYPAASTPGCTKQAGDFTAARDELSAEGIDVIGISPDPPPKLARFRDEENLTITLLCDADKAVLTAYGAYGTKKLYGRRSPASCARRSCWTPRARWSWRSTTSRRPGTWRSSAAIWPAESLHFGRNAGVV